MPSLTTDRLAEQQRTEQAQQALLVALLVARYFEAVDRGDIATTGAAFLNAVVPLVLGRRAAAATLSLRYLNSMRLAETGVRELLRLAGPEGLTPTPVSPMPEIIIPRGGVDVDEAAVRRSLAITGPVRYDRALDAGQPEPAARAAARNAVTGAAVRHVLNGGREAGLAVAQGDPRALGYYRVPKPNACFFCLALASRGIDYKGDSFDASDPRFEGSGTVKVHDSCGCVMLPAYSRTVTDRQQALTDLWEQNATGTGHERMLSFRRAIYAQRRAEAAAL